MKASVDTDLVSMAPGSSAEIGLDIVNTSEVIDGVTARILGLADHHVSSRPAVLPLFPDSAGRMTLRVAVPQGYPAGRHPLTVELRSRQADIGPTYLDLDLQVGRSAGVDLAAAPEVVRSRRTARYSVAVTNLGNIGLDVSITVADPERVISAQVEPATVTVPPDGAVDVLVLAKGPRMLLGTEVDRPITVTVLARPVDVPRPAAPENDAPAPNPGESADHAEDLTATATLTLRQRPWFTRGLLTALILLAIIAGWAAVFLFGLGQVFGNDPLPKNAPASFYAAPAATVADPAVQGPPDKDTDTGPVTGTDDRPGAPGAGVGTGQGGNDAEPPGGSPAGEPGAAVAAPVPAGALPKDGALPAGTGGSISGTVTAATDGAPAGRIMVEALRRNADGEWMIAGSAASQADGSYEIPGLFPSSYVVRLSAAGYDTVYAPAAARPEAARQVQVASEQVSPGTDAVITGQPASISGSIDPGDITTEVAAEITVRMVGAPATQEPAATVTTDADGKYQITELPAPADYELVFTTEGYQTSTVRARVDGGAERLQPTVVLRAANGSISGTIMSGDTKVGKATVSITVGGKEISTGTPTSGRTGEFVLGDLPTPATYVITVTADGYAPNGAVIDLEPGQQLVDTVIELSPSSGQVTGVLVDADGNGLGGATVTVGGGIDLPEAQTLTTGTVGAFTLENLPSPGSYTLTFSLAGYADQTIPLVLSGGEPQSKDVILTSALGSLSGQVRDAGGAPVAEATVTATDGVRTWPVTTTASAGVVPAGGYVITGLVAGTYTVTAVGPDGTGRTALVTVTGGEASSQDFALTEAG